MQRFIIVFVALLAAVCAAARPLAPPAAVAAVLPAAPASSVAAPQPALGDAVDGQFIVVFKAGAGGASAAAASLVARVQQSVPAAARAASARPAVTVLRSLADHPTAGLTAAAAAPATGVQAAVVAVGHPAALAAMRAAPEVAAVIPDTVVAAQQVQQQQPPAAPQCVDAASLSRGLAASSVSLGFKWPACLSNRTELRWIGERCGASMDQVAFTAVYAVYKSRPNMVVRVQGEECVLTPAVSTSRAWQRLRFGSCGQAPAYARTLPTCIKAAAAAPAAAASAASSSDVAPAVCIAASSSSADATEQLTVQVSTEAPVYCGSRHVQSLTYFGAPCGPQGQFVAWTRAVGAGGCTLAPVDGQVRYNSLVFGSCGVPPGTRTLTGEALPALMCANSTLAVPSPAPEQPSPSPAPQKPSPSPVPPPVEQPSPSPEPQVPSPSPVPSPEPQVPSPSPAPSQWPQLPRVAVQAGDQVPAGLTRIEAATAAGVPSGAGVAAAQAAYVAVLDSGVDAKHPDLNYAGGFSWVADSGANDADAGVDNFGHGTHVAGIVGARNNGAGVVGVAPGVPLISLKVLDGAGRGTLSTVLSALKWVSTVGVASGVRVVNLSLAAFVDPASPTYAAAVDLVCGVFQEASDAGVVVTVASGNYATNLAGYLPAACPSVVAVTALDETLAAPAGYSNYMAASAAPSQTARVIAAPGTNVRSTMPLAHGDGSGYAVLSGTSMAAPHVAGVAANCIMAGACAPGSSGAASLATLQAAAQARSAAPPAANQRARYGFVGDATSTLQGRYYGFLVWSGGF